MSNSVLLPSPPLDTGDRPARVDRSGPTCRRTTVIRVTVAGVAVLAALATSLASPAGARADLGPTPAEAADTVEVGPGPALTGVRSVATGEYQSCAVLQTRAVCVVPGYNGWGSLGHRDQDQPHRRSDRQEPGGHRAAHRGDRGRRRDAPHLCAPY